MSLFEITIQRKEGDAWPVVVRHQPGSGGPALWSRGWLALDLAALDLLLPSAQAYGLLLGQALFQADLRDAFVRAAAEAKVANESLRVLLILDAEELRGLHWEQMHAPLDRGWDYLLLNQGTPFSLYQPSQVARRFSPIGRGDLSALLLVSGPEELAGDYPLAPFDIAATVQSVQRALGDDIPCQVLASVEGAAGPPMLNALCEHLTAGQPTLLHVVCHGAYSQNSGDTVLYFPKDDGRSPVSATDLVHHLGRLDRLPHFAFLSTCESAVPNAETGLGGLGQRLVRDLGMPAALAMTGRISILTAQAMASAFYARLREHGEVDRALCEALSGLQGRHDVTVPALFSRLGGRPLWSDALGRDGRLAESLRGKEQAYLDALLARYQFWQDHYTPLAGIAEIRAAVGDGSRLDLPVHFVPPGFEKLIERGYGERAEVQRVEVDDLRTTVTEHRRILLLGEPGSGKTTTLWRLCHDYATTAQRDPHAPLPVLVSLGGYTGSGPFDSYLGQRLGPLAPYLETYRASGRLILLLDGLNEMPQAGYAARVGRIREALERWPEETVVITCRALDYVVKLEGLQWVEVSPLDEARVRTFLHNYLGQTAGERLFWAMAGGDEVRALWETWRTAGGNWLEFWAAEEMPKKVYEHTSFAQDRLWARLREEPPALLALGRNPYLLLMTAQVYAGSKERLPANRARLFADFVDTLLEREKERHPERWLPAERQVDALAALAHAMQVEGGRGTTVERTWTANLLRQAAPGLDAERLLYLASSASLLDADEASVRFYHHLLQEFFAARELGRRVAAGQAMSRYWPGGRWWEPSGWEETTLLLAGLEPDASEIVAAVSSANPVVAARCLVEGDARVDEGTRTRVVGLLLECMTDVQKPAAARVQAGDALARLGDPRPGVGLRPDGLPDIAWCEVPAGLFLMGSDKRRDTGAYDNELPQHEVQLPAYSVSKYPLTNAQYEAFVQDGGYSDRWRRCWAEAGWRWKGDRTGPEAYGGVFDLPNHPVVMVTWYEALAFCRWLTERLRETGELGADREVRLPTEAEWEKAARGSDGRVYPWGNDFDAEKCNMADTGIRTTSAVGIFPSGASPYGVLDLSGNVWEWTRSLWGKDWGAPEFKYPYNPADGRGNLEARREIRRVLRGGSSVGNQWDVRCASRYRGYPNYRRRDYGLRVVVAPVPSGL